MNNISLFPWVGDSKANVVIQMSSDDLIRFSQDLIDRTKKEYVTLVQEREEEKYLTREEVKSILNVCDATFVKSKLKFPTFRKFAFPHFSEI